jgi:type II secretory pathway pseudopilin PulG/ribosomal protein L37E
MGSVTCERCGFVSFATSEFCKQCGGPLLGPQSARNWRSQPQPNWQQQQQADAAGWTPPPAQGWPPPHDTSSQYYGGGSNYYAADDNLPKRKGLAVVAMLCGLLALPALLVGALAAIALGAPAALLGAVVGLVLTILSLTLGIAGTVRVNKNPSEFGGKGMAVAGIVLGSLLLVSVVPVGIISAIAIPNLLAARRAANEGSAISSLRTLGSAQATYYSTAGNGGYGDLNQLRGASLIQDRQTAEVNNGYRFELSIADDSYEVTATPVDYPKSGVRSFYLSEDGVIRAADKRGGAADAGDLPIASDRYADSQDSAGGEDVDWTESGPVMRRANSPSYGRR